MKNLEGKVDVIMCTYNSNKPWFKRCLNSIKREIPICHFIVIDRFSRDGTQEVIKEIFPEALIIESTLNLGRARAEAIKYVDTEYFVFVDDDIELSNRWYKEITKFLSPNTGAIAFMGIPVTKWLKKFFLSTQDIAKSLKRRWVSEWWVNCANTLIKTELVKDWLPPSFISAGEDAHLSKHILSKGYKVVLIQGMYVKHYGLRGLKSAQKKLWYCSNERLLRNTNITTKILLRRFFFSPLRGLYVSIKLKEAMVIPYTILSDIYALKGWLRWNKYVMWKR